ncbi:CinA family protein [Elioraea sp.]|uniref:CinA family protein n=1 Tax=Elioraea sp. TaxID=2185103 RepID=UPI0025C5D8D9|nr:nicotinamide-nucleotide amidohydrolase family protein [Elioraea sp.]
MTPLLLAEAEALLALFREKRLMIVTAESCTGGLIAATLTAIAGSSDVLDRGFVTYSNDAKRAMLGVSEETLARVGAVSEEVSREMADGALGVSTADVALSVTGIAGPGGATETKPVGLVFIGAARRGGTLLVERHVFAGDRAAVRNASVSVAFRLARTLAG